MVMGKYLEDINVINYLINKLNADITASEYFEEQHDHDLLVKQLDKVSELLRPYVGYK